MQTAELLINLHQFIGTENYHRTNPLFAPDMVHTDGVQYFADNAHAYWFIDLIAINVKQRPALKKEPFLVICLSVLKDKATITFEDGDCNTLCVEKIDYTDCPTGLWKFYLADNVLMLPSEY